MLTDSVKDNAGAAVVSDASYTACLSAATPYCASLSRAVGSTGLAPRNIVAASVFTTMSATAWLEHARAILDYVPPAPTLAQPQSTFRLADLSALVLHEQVSADGTK